MGNEADTYYNEERELGLHTDTEYAGAGGEERGRARARPGELGPYAQGGELDRRYEEEMSGSKNQRPPSKNPFDDREEAPASLRGVSPRPVGEGAHGGKDGDDERRSSFRENM